MNKAVYINQAVSRAENDVESACYRLNKMRNEVEENSEEWAVLKQCESELEDELRILRCIKLRIAIKFD